MTALETSLKWRYYKKIIKIKFFGVTDKWAATTINVRFIEKPPI